MGGQLNMLKIKSANKWRPEGPQVKISIMLMGLANISYRHSTGIMKASFVGSCLTKFNNKAIFGHKLCDSFLTQQLKEKKKKRKINNKIFHSPQLLMYLTLIQSKTIPPSLEEAATNISTHHE